MPSRYLAAHVRRCVLAVATGLLVFSSSGAYSQAPPGPIEVLPYEEAFITEAWKDLLQSTSNQIADWTGWQGSTWESPNAYDGHPGTDFALESGTPLFALASGTVIELANQYPEKDRSTYYGNYVKIALDGTGPQGEAIDVIYGHMLPTIQVSVGQHVTTATLVGQSDNTGNSTSEHVHIECRVRATGEQVCPFYSGYFKYPIMFNSNVNRQVGHVVRVSAASTPIRSGRFDSSSVITTAYQNQMFFACYWQRGYYCVFIPNSSSYRTGWIKALDVTEVFDGTVLQTLPDPGAYVHSATLQSPYAIRSAPDASAAVVGQILKGGGRYVADQVQNGWYRIALPGSVSWGWVLPDSRMIVYPQLYNPALSLANRPSNSFPVAESFATPGRCLFGTSKFNRSEVKSFSPASPNGDGNAVFITDSTNTGNGVCESVIYGKVDSRNYYVEADCYFKYHSLSDGYEVYGIFARDDGFAGLDQTFEGKGNCYGLLYDTSTGQVIAARIVDSAVTDLQAKRKYVTTSGWHKLRIECRGDVIAYYLDGQLLVQVTDTTFASGPCGLGYSFHKRKSYPVGRGAYFDNFSAGAL